MVEVIVGDLFESNAQTLVNTVNCVGVMGKGIALEFKKRFPKMFEDYVARCQRHEVRLGEPYLYRELLPPWVLNFPTKGHWRSVTNLDDIVRGLEYLIGHYEKWGITSLAVPPLGCGNGQLEWRIVGPTLVRYLSRLQIPVELYAPYGTPHEELQSAFLDRPESDAVPAMPAPEWVPAEWIVIAEIVKRILDEPYHPPIGRTILQKIAFVASTQGLPTGLQFKRGSFGPFSPDIKRMEARLINNGLLHEEPLGNMHRVTIGPTFEAARRAYGEDLASWQPVIERTADLFLRLDSVGAEIVATALFVAGEFRDNGVTPTENMVFEAIMEWKQRRKPALDEGEVAMSIRSLSELNWIAALPSPDLPLPDAELMYA